MANKALWDAAIAAFTAITPASFTSLANNTLSAVSSIWDNSGAAAGTYNTSKKTHYWLDVNLVFNGTPTAGAVCTIFAQKSIDGGVSNFESAPSTTNLLQYFLSKFVANIVAQASSNYAVKTILGPFEADPTAYQFWLDNRSGVALNTGSYIKVFADDLDLNG